MTLRDIDVDDFMSDHPVCSCDGSPFIYKPADHIVTGNLSIVCCNVLEDILTKGPKYREPRSFSWNKNCNSIIMNYMWKIILGSGLKTCVDDSDLSA